MAKRKPAKVAVPEVRLTEKLRRDIVDQVKHLIEEVMYASDVWDIIDEHVQVEYTREGDAWLELDGPASVLCSIGSGDAVFRLPLDVNMIDVDDPRAPQDDNKRRLTCLLDLMVDLDAVRQKLSEAIEHAQAKHQPDVSGDR
jgi:hypothetical protein